MVTSNIVWEVDHENRFVWLIKVDKWSHLVSHHNNLKIGPDVFSPQKLWCGVGKQGSAFGLRQDIILLLITDISNRSDGGAICQKPSSQVLDSSSAVSPTARTELLTSPRPGVTEILVFRRGAAMSTWTIDSRPADLIRNKNNPSAGGIQPRCGGQESLGRYHPAEVSGKFFDFFQRHFPVEKEKSDRKLRKINKIFNFFYCSMKGFKKISNILEFFV